MNLANVLGCSLRLEDVDAFDCLDRFEGEDAIVEDDGEEISFQFKELDMLSSRCSLLILFLEEATAGCLLDPLLLRLLPIKDPPLTLPPPLEPWTMLRISESRSNLTSRLDDLLMLLLFL